MAVALLSPHVVYTPHLMLGLAGVVRLCTQGHLCPANAAGGTWCHCPACEMLTLSVILAPSPGESVCADSHWIPQCPWLSDELVLRHQGHSCMVQTAACLPWEGRIYSSDSALHWCSHMASGLQLVMEQVGNVRNCSWDCSCVLIPHVKMILRSFSTENIKVQNSPKESKSNKYRLSVCFAGCTPRGQRTAIPCISSKSPEKIEAL